MPIRTAVNQTLKHFFGQRNQNDVYEIDSDDELQFYGGSQPHAGPFWKINYRSIWKSSKMWKQSKPH